jgi:hypothetical protein
MDGRFRDLQAKFASLSERLALTEPLPERLQILNEIKLVLDETNTIVQRAYLNVLARLK